MVQTKRLFVNMESLKKQKNLFANYFKEHRDDSIPDWKITDGKNVKNKKILVVGVGTGRDVSFLAKHNDIYAVDISSEGLQIAWKKGIRVKKCDVDKEKLPYKNNVFDIVICKDIFEHLVNPMFLLREIKRVLAKRGYVVINIPNHFYWWYRLRLLFGKNLLWKVLGQDHTKLYDEWDYMHIRFFTWKGMQKFLAEAEFRVTKTFWDFGTLAYYNDPDFVMGLLKNKKAPTVVERLLIQHGNLAWNRFNSLFPKKIRARMVSLDPGFFCASFYVWCRVTK